MQVGQTDCCITCKEECLLSLWWHLVLTRLLTANWLRHFVALLLVLNPVVDDADLLPVSDNIIQDRKGSIHMVAVGLGQTCIPDGAFAHPHKLSLALDEF